MKYRQHASQFVVFLFLETSLMNEGSHIRAAGLLHGTDKMVWQVIINGQKCLGHTFQVA